MKIVADHSRAMTFLVGDGVLPSNEDRGYVLRRIVRRAVRHGRLLGIGEIFLPRMVEVVIETMGGAYPELKQNAAFITAIVRSEEERFSHTLRGGLAYLEEAVADLAQKGKTEIPGEVVFHLHDTLGFPLELTRELAREKGLSLDEGGFEELMEEQRRRARAARVEEGYSASVPEVYSEVLDNYGESLFTGYEKVEEEARVVALVSGGRVVPEAFEGDEVEVILDRTPFYGEMGGQVGDTGAIVAAEGEVEVTDAVRPAPGLISHRCRVKRGKLRAGDEVTARIDAERRDAIRRNHTATHLLHWSLRQVLGEHAKQAGSLVDPKRLRFDFTHFGPLSREELARVEELANRRILEDLPVRAYVTTYEYATSINAIALFGEKYQDHVRVVEVDEISRELCGGTHVGRTGEIGLLIITSEGGIGANMRRIEAVTGMEAYRLFRERRELLEETASALKTDTARIPERVARLQQRIKELEGELRKRERGELSALAGTETAWREEELPQGLVMAAAIPDLSPRELRELAEHTLSARGAKAVGIASVQGGKANMVIALGKDALEAGLDAVELVRKCGRLLGGGGGGRSDMAVGGGGRPEGVEEALELFLEEMRSALKGRDA